MKTDHRLTDLRSLLGPAELRQRCEELRRRAAEQRAAVRWWAAECRARNAACRARFTVANVAAATQARRTLRVYAQTWAEARALLRAARGNAPAMESTDANEAAHAPKTQHLPARNVPLDIHLVERPADVRRTAGAI